MRKGFSTPIFLIPSLIIIIFALFFYTVFIFATDSGSKSIDSIDLQKNDVNSNLLTFLKSQVSFNNKNITVYELINLWYYNKENSKILEDTTKKAFIRIYGDCYYFTIWDNNEIVFSSGINTNIKDFEESINLPVFNKDLVIKLNPSNYYRIKNIKVCGLNE